MEISAAFVNTLSEHAIVVANDTNDMQLKEFATVASLMYETMRKWILLFDTFTMLYANWSDTINRATADFRAYDERQQLLVQQWRDNAEWYFDTNTMQYELKNNLKNTYNTKHK